MTDVLPSNRSAIWAAIVSVQFFSLLSCFCCNDLLPVDISHTQLCSGCQAYDLHDWCAWRPCMHSLSLFLVSFPIAARYFTISECAGISMYIYCVSMVSVLKCKCFPGHSMWATPCIQWSAFFTMQSLRGFTLSLQSDFATRLYSLAHIVKYTTCHFCLCGSSEPLIGNRQHNQSTCSETRPCNVNGLVVWWILILSEWTREQSTLLDMVDQKIKCGQKFSKRKVTVSVNSSKWKTLFSTVRIKVQLTVYYHWKLTHRGMCLRWWQALLLRAITCVVCCCQRTSVLHCQMTFLSTFVACRLYTCFVHQECVKDAFGIAWFICKQFIVPMPLGVIASLLQIGYSEIVHFFCFHHSFHFTRLWKKVLNKEPRANITNSTSIASFSRGWNRTINLLACTCNWVSEEHGKIKNLYFGKPKNSLHIRCVWRGHIFCYNAAQIFSLNYCWIFIMPFHLYEEFWYIVGTASALFIFAVVCILQS